MAAISFNEQGLAEIVAGGKIICLINKSHQIKACAQKCPHAGGRLAEGFVDAAGNIVCPLHRYKFSLRNGHNTSGEGYYLKTFPVQVNLDEVFVGLEENNFWNWLK